MKRHTSIAVLLCAAFLSSCDLFDENAVQDITGPTPTTARIKFHNFSPSSVGVNFFANDVKMTAISTSACTPLPTVDSLKVKCQEAGIESATGVVYGTCTAGACSGGLASAGLYAAIAPGQYTLTAKMAAKDTIVSTVAQTIENDKYYSFFMSGIYNTTTKTAEAFIVEDPIPTGTIDFTVAHVRFVNAISNGTGDLNLFATNTTTATETAVGSAVAYKAANAFMTLPAGTYDLRVRYTGVATNLITRTGLSLVGGRVYTVTTRGSTATASTLGLDFTSNQQ
jgi:hypothetical protein